MSQKKTVVPGMEDDHNSYTNHEDLGHFYSRGTTNLNSQNRGGTVVPGINDCSQNAQQSWPQQLGNVGSKKPVAGFLYSISRQGIGEYWPLHVGPNFIGSSPECDICLREGTVSARHAELVIRKMKNPEKMVASISDTRSTNGTMINGESLSFSAVECYNRDVLTVGENYVLVLILIDVNQFGLCRAEQFIAMDQQEEDIDMEEPHFNPDMYNPNKSHSTNFNGKDLSDGDGNGRGRGTTDIGGTVGMDGTNSNIKPGGTVGM